eukprot:11207408-Ditylum_brightwellii.AAC.1
MHVSDESKLGSTDGIELGSEDGILIGIPESTELGSKDTVDKLAEGHELGESDGENVGLEVGLFDGNTVERKEGHAKGPLLEVLL